MHAAFGKGFAVQEPAVIDSLFTGLRQSEVIEMKRGTKPVPASTKARRGTAPSAATHPRDEVEIDLPRVPSGFPAPAQEVWNDLVVLVDANKLATEKDSQAFANMCQLQAHVTAQFRLYFEGKGESPSVAAIAELRKQLEVFGLGGVKSRVGQAPGASKVNPFARHGVRPA